MSDPFEGIENSYVSSGGRYITPGRYRLTISQLTLFDSQARPGVKYFCLEAVVLHTTSPDYREGDTVTWLQDMTKQAAQGNVLGFALALNPGAKKADINKEVMWELVSAANPANGLTVDVDAYKAMSKEKREYTRYNWNHAEGEWQAPTSIPAPAVDNQAIVEAASSAAMTDSDVPF